MPRIYVVTFEKVGVTAVQDLIEIDGAANKMLRILEVSVADVDSTIPTAQQVALRCRILPATVTPGTGGTSPTPAKTDQGDAAATFTAKANSTGKATTSGTAVVVRQDGAFISAGYSYAFPKPPTVNPVQAFVFELITAPAAAATWVLSGTVTVEETG